MECALDVLEHFAGDAAAPTAPACSAGSGGRADGSTEETRDRAESTGGDVARKAA